MIKVISKHNPVNIKLIFFHQFPYTVIIIYGFIKYDTFYYYL